MTAYRRVYDSRHLQADCQEPGSAPEPYARYSSIGYLFNFYRRHRVSFTAKTSKSQNLKLGTNWHTTYLTVHCRHSHTPPVNFNTSRTDSGWLKMTDMKWRTIEIAGYAITGRENDGPNCKAWTYRTWEFLGHKNARREIAVHEIIYAGHEIAGQK